MLHAALLLAIGIAQNGAILRGGCALDDSVIGTMPAGAQVELRFSVSDGSDCVKIAATLDGKRMEGYVSGSALSGLDQFQRERRNAPDSGVVQVVHPYEAPGKERPSSKDPDRLFQAGLSAYRSDQVKSALDYWKQSLDLRPDDSLARLYSKVEREAAGDHSGEKLFGLHVALRYEGETLPPETARGMVAILDEEFTRVANTLGCSTGQPVVAIVQSRTNYLRSTDAAEWSGGQFDDRIRVSYPGADRRVLAHEIVHACLASLSPSWPSWLHEGLAQKLSGDALTPAARDQIRSMAAAHAIPRLENMGQAWSRMSAQHARTAYNVALAATELLLAEYASSGIRNVLSNPDRLPEITAFLDRRLGL